MYYHIFKNNSRISQCRLLPSGIRSSVHLLSVIMLFFFPGVNILLAQEVFDNNAIGEYVKNTQVHSMYPMDSARFNDYRHPGDAAYRITGSATGKAKDRFDVEQGALEFSSYNHVVAIPAKVTGDIVSNNQGFSISFWVKIAYPTQPCDIFQVRDNSGARLGNVISLRLKDGYLQVLKYSTYAKKLVVMGQARYKVSLRNDNSGGDISPNGDTYERGNGEAYARGFIFVCITSDQYATRLYYSRPGGKLYANYFWFGLTDVLKSQDDIVFGRESGAKTIECLDDIMVYKQPLTPEQTLNHFLLQSPPYPGRTYIVKAYDNSCMIPDLSNSYGYGGGYIKVMPDDVNGIYGFSRWYMSLTDPGNQMRFINAHSMNRIARWNRKTGNYYYQENAVYNDIRDKFRIERISDGNYNRLLDPGIAQYHFPVVEYEKEKYQLGINEDDLYLQNGYQKDTRWRVTGSFKSSVRDNFSTGSEKIIYIKNYGSKRGMGLYWGGANYYLIEKNDIFEPFYLLKKAPAYDNISFKYGQEDYCISNTAKTGHLHPSSDAGDGSKIYMEKSGCYNWQLAYVKDDPNGKPLYLIRANNGIGAPVLVGNVGDNQYIVQHQISENGDFPDHFLWSVNVNYGYTPSSATGKMLPEPYLAAEDNQHELYDPAPNPANSSATIRYRLAEPSAAAIYVTDISGRRLRTVLISASEEAGNHTLDLDVSGMTAGVYFCTLETPGFKVSKKLIVIK